MIIADTMLIIADMIISDVWSSAEAVPPGRLGDSDLIKVRFGALSGLKPDISRGPLRARMCCKTRVLFTARPDLSIAEPVVFSTVPSGGAID